MAYKVLGQTTSTAPSTAAVITNLVKDPSFADAASFTRIAGSAGASTATVQLNSTSNWAYTNSTSTSAYISNSLYYGINAKYGSAGTAWGTYFSGGGSVDIYIGYGNKATTSSNISNTSAPNSFDITRAMPVTPSATYYLSYDIYRVGSDNSVNAWQINQWDANGVIVTGSGANSTITSNAWVRNSHSVTLNSATAYVTFYFASSYSTSGRGFFFDGVSFSTDTGYNTTFTEPPFADVAALTSPFDKKTNGFTGNTPYTTSSLSYAGAQNTLYTTPAGSSAVASTLSVSNLSQSATTYRYAVVPSGQTIAKKHWIAFDIPIAANSTTAYTIGQTLAAGDKIVVVADTDNVAFTLFGNES
jgi:hypothetical protein